MESIIERRTYVWQLLHEITKAFEYESVNYPIQYEGSTLGDQNGIYADISKIKQYLFWEPTVNLENGVVRMAEWLKATRK